MVAPSRSTILCALVLVAGCLKNPKKPAPDPDDDGGAGEDALIVPGETGLDGPPRPSPDGRADLSVPVEPGPDGGTEPEAGPPDALPPDVGPDVPGCTPACTDGARRCGPNGGLQTCAPVAGCLAWGAESTCGDNATCTGGEPMAACACKAAPSCNGPGTFCKDASTVGTCAKDSFGCVYVTTMTTACPGGQLCGGSAPNGACGCSNTCSAAQVGTYCVDGKTVATCTASNGCFASSGSMTCPGHQSCQGAAGSAACKCPAAGTTEGSSCTTVGVTGCDGTSVLTCTAEAGSGCHLWVKTTDCATLAGGPFACGTRGGTAACQCPDPSATQLFVDPVAGHDTATVPPNGASAPAACRYKTITKALTAVTATRRRLVATTGTPPASFTDETFPLVLPSNVTLDTADVTPTPANYTIVFDSPSAATAISMGDGSVLEGFTVQAATGNAAAAAISCSAGAVTVRRCVIAGAGAAAASKPATGIAIGLDGNDTCTANLTNLTVRNFKVGLSVSTTSSTAVTVTDTTLRDNGLATTSGAGLLIAAGKVTATRLTINKSAAGTATWGAVLDATTAAVVPSLTATDLTIADLTRAGLHLVQGAGMAAPAAILNAGDIRAGSSSDCGAHVQAGGLTLNGTNVHQAGSDGLCLEGGTALVGAGSKLDGNGRDGLRVAAGTATVGAAGGAAVSISNNLGIGVNLLGDGGAVVAALKNCTIGQNFDQGVVIGQGATFTTTTTMEGNDVTGNNRTANRAVGGILFATASTLAGFTGNKVHANNGDEIGFDAQPNGGDTWNLAGDVGCAGPNQIYCYTSGNGSGVGLRILDSAPMGTKVNAAGTSWTNLVPTKGTDFEFDMTKFAVTAAPACAAVTATCN